ncbi:MAG: hypothetical protein HY320_02910 [Armatimonadetes bacterium]|nr:hypothetical protein [Armatimonadota bacterium]
MPFPGSWFDDLFEALFYRLLRVEVLENDPEALLAMGSSKHWGRSVTLADGTVIRHGDPIAEFHFRRQALRLLDSGSNPRPLGIGLYRLLKRDLPRLAAWVARDPRFADIRALHAISPFHYGAPRIGFEVMDLPTAFSGWCFTVWQRGIMRRTHPRGAQRLTRHREEPVVSKQVWMSRARLMELWGPGGTLIRQLVERER